MIELWHNCSLFPLHTSLNFPNILQGTCIVFIIGQREQCLLFSETKAPLPFQCGNPAKTLFLDSTSERASRMLVGTAAEDVIYGNLPRGWHHPWNLFKINLTARANRDLWIKPGDWKAQERIDLRKTTSGLWPEELLCICLGLLADFPLCSVYREGLLFPNSPSSKKEFPQWLKGYFCFSSWAWVRIPDATCVGPIVMDYW